MTDAGRHGRPLLIVRSRIHVYPPGGYAYEKASMGVAIANSFCQKNSMGGAVLNGPHACNT
jgi:hypothetical protein